MAIDQCMNPRAAKICGLVTTTLLLLTWFYTSLGHQHVAHGKRSIPKVESHELRHLLLPANHRDINLCKTMLGLSILGYPTPSLLSWDQATAFPNSLDDGAQVYSKIVRTMDYFNNLPHSRDHELALVADGYDVWFQLRPDVLVSRYHDINREANARLRDQLGPRTIEAANIDQKILFAASKRCSNQLHVRACYAVPEAPTPLVYGNNTDTPLGRTLHSAYRPRFLGDGFIMGPVGSLRALFVRAQAVAEALPEVDEQSDNGSRDSDFIYHGHVTSVFARLFGDQEYAREAVRRRVSGASTWQGRIFGLRHDPLASTKLDGMYIEDRLDPPFTHEPAPLGKWKENTDEEFEFGIGLDYDARIMMNTQESYHDGFFLKHNKSDPFSIGDIKNNVLLQHQQMPEDRKSKTKNPVWKSVQEQIVLGTGEYSRTSFDCKADAAEIPEDVKRSKGPYDDTPPSIITKDGGETPREAPTTLGWNEISLYTNICYKTIPAMIHHDGDKSMRNELWEQVWWQPWAPSLLMNAKIHKKENGPVSWAGGAGSIRSQDLGAWSDKGLFLRWERICPADYRHELYRGKE